MKEQEDIDLTDEDLKAALQEMKTYVDITEEDLHRIFALAMRHARQRTGMEGPVKDIMTISVVTIRPSADIHEAARLMAENNISGLPVIDTDGRVAGLVSEADILALAGLERQHTFLDIIRHLLGEPVPKGSGSTVAEVMTAPAVTISPGSPISEAARIMDKHRIKRLPVVDAEGRLLGIISRADIVKASWQR